MVHVSVWVEFLFGRWNGMRNLIFISNVCVQIYSCITSSPIPIHFRLHLSETQSNSIDFFFSFCFLSPVFTYVPCNIFLSLLLLKWCFFNIFCVPFIILEVRWVERNNKVSSSTREKCLSWTVKLPSWNGMRWTWMKRTIEKNKIWIETYIYTCATTTINHNISCAEVRDKITLRRWDF